MTESPPLAGRRALVTGGDRGFGQAVLRGLRDAGAEAAPLALTRADREGVLQAVDAAVSELGGLDVVVHAELGPSLLTSRPLCELDPADWEACESALQTAIFVLQAAFQHLHARGGRILVISPTASVVGAAGLVPLTTCVEAVRVLAKTAAKQWGRHGITVNSLAPGLDALFDAGLAPRVALGEPALPDFEPRRDAAPIVSFLASEASAALTGATLRIDGGTWTAG